MNKICFWKYSQKTIGSNIQYDKSHGNIKKKFTLSSIFVHYPLNVILIEDKTARLNYWVSMNLIILHIHTLLWFNDELPIPICKYKHYMMMMNFLKHG
jgi:hypothetical protein